MQHNKSVDEYTWLMCVLAQKEATYGHQDWSQIDDVTNPDVIFNKYTIEYTLNEQKNNTVVYFILNHGCQKNFIEEELNEFYKNDLDELIDLSTISDDFKKAIERRMKQSNLEFTNETIPTYLNDPDFDNTLIDQNGNTMLGAAIELNNTQLAYQILQQPNIDLNQPDELGQTPFIVACQTNTDIARAMAHHSGVDVNKKRFDGQTGFHCAVSQNPECAQVLMNIDQIDLNEPDEHGFTPFRTACFCSHNCAYIMLENNDVDCNQQDHNGNTPFLKICQMAYVYRNEDIDTIKDILFLIYTMEQSGRIDFEIKNNFGQYAHDFLKNKSLQKKLRNYKKVKPNKQEQNKFMQFLTHSKKHLQ